MAGSVDFGGAVWACFGRAGWAGSGGTALVCFGRATLVGDGGGRAIVVTGVAGETAVTRGALLLAAALFGFFTLPLIAMTTTTTTTTTTIAAAAPIDAIILPLSFLPDFGRARATALGVTLGPCAGTRP